MRSRLEPTLAAVTILASLLTVLHIAGCGSDSVTPPPPPDAWVQIESGTTELLLDVFFVNETVGTIVGTSGTILRTTDGGETWTTQQSGTSADLFAIHLADEITGTAVGGLGGGSRSTVAILCTTNGGRTWQNQAPEALVGSLSDVFFPDAHTGIAVGERGMILRTTDGGATWFEQGSPTTGQLLKGVGFTDTSKGTIVGDHILLRTTDGGGTWVKHEEPVRWLFAVHFANSTTATAVGVLGTIIRTEDGFDSWVTQWGDVFSNFQSVFFVEPDVGYTVGGNSILHTRDGGETWERQTALRAGLQGYYSVWFTDERTGVVVGDGGTILRTTTGGE